MVSPVAGTNLLSYYQGQTALSLLSSSGSTTGASSSSSNSAALLNYLTQKEGLASTTSSVSAVKAPTAPWSASNGVPTVSTAVQNAINGTPFVDPGSAKLDAPGGVSTSNYKNLFALYQGLNTLYDLAQTAANAGTSSASSSLSNVTSAQLQSTFNSGIAQVQNFLSNAPFTGFNLTSGKVSTTQQSTVGIPNGAYQTYTTGVIGTGQEESPLKALQGAVQFNISVTNKFASTTVKNPDGTTKTITSPPTNISIDLSGLGSRPRTIDNVVNYINQQLQAAGVTTRFAAANLGNAPVTTTVNGKTTTTATGDPQWGLTVNGGASETVSFSAPSTSTALYLGMATGGASTFASSSSSSTSSTSATTTTPTGEQIMKLQTGANVVGTAPTLTANSTNPSLPTGGVFAKALPEGVTSVQASATASDGSVYMLANASGTLNGAPVPGSQGVALLKYDSAGKLLYSKVLAGEQNATGFSLAVNTDGSVAVAGTNTVPASVSSAGLTTPSSTSAFVQVYDSTGAPTWSQTVPATGGVSAASGVAFSPDGSMVYLSGATTGSVGNQTPKGSSDEFIQGFLNNVTTAKTNAGNVVGQPTFTIQYGATGGANTSSGMAVDAATGTIYTAGIENGKAVVRSFSPNATKAPTALASRSLGTADSLVGIGLSNGQVVVGGNVSHATVTAGTVTQAYSGVGDGFVASISSSLTAQPGDTLTYLGQPGVTQTATSMAISAGQVYVTGTEANDPNSLAANGATEGFVAGVDTSSGAISYTSKFAGANGQAIPTAISAAGTGASVLDQLGLPAGTLNAASSGLIVGATSVKAGDSFYVRTAPGGAQTQITISATDTLTTLVNKLNTALGPSGKAAIQTVGPNSELTITPTDASDFIELDSQPAAQDTPYSQLSSSSGTDVLSALGLSSGVIRTVATINGLTDVKQLREYGLSLPTNLNLSTAANAQHAANALQAAMVAVQNAYKDLVTPPTMASEQAAQAASTSGSVPTYLTNEIANYKAGLSRLLANQSSTSSSSSSGGIASLFK